ncbi:MAG TPA: methylated-DNA--[protein]-cysteine S-methyltransferase [Thermomicrobiales bacterium]|nr:methylated-DNA--[protein]-cysteine S-methyltransferase [Thermomicrobiales bacterium]
MERDERDERGGLADARALARGLRRLGEAAPPAELRPGVLAAVDLADRYWRLDSPLGPVYVAYNARGVAAVSRAPDAATFEADFLARRGRPAYPVATPPAALARAVAARLDGERRANLTFDLRGLSEFERAVLTQALAIPRGQVRPYAWVAREIGHPGAVRAVGTALGRNPIPLLIPCHRVVRSDGRPGDYAFGGAAKRAVLAAEGVAPEDLEALARTGVRYYGSDTTHIYCFPTCHHARRATERHRVTFASAREAASAGYRPCRVCRP